MLSSTPKKRGRPQARYRCRDGTEIQGLTRFSDGRWKICATGKTFVEPDEILAVRRFREATEPESNLGKLKVHPDAETAMIDILKRTIRAGGGITATVKPVGDGSRAWAVVDDHLSPDQWKWLNRAIIERPRWVAEQVGIEQIAWLPNLKRSTESPRLAELIEVYAAKPGITQEEIVRCRRFWKEFSDIVSIQTIRELQHDHIERYEAAIAEKALAPKSVKHRFTRIRTVIAYAMKRGKGQEDCRSALDKLTMLEVENVNSLDPNPIKPGDFWKIHRAAEKAGDNAFAALMVFALNAALYSSEVGNVRWDDIDLVRAEFAARRNKTRVPRVAVLWPETVRAVKELPRDRPTVFNTSVQAYNRFSVHRDWTRYREVAKVKDGVTFAMIRDAAFTIACRASGDQARVLSGHRLPGAVDHYVLRNPQFVSDACAAIRHEFLSGRHR